MQRDRRSRDPRHQEQPEHNVEMERKRLEIKMIEIEREMAGKEIRLVLEAIEKDEKLARKTL
jgi:hypothetical protein